MAETILMPRQGNSVESCVLNKWHVKEGDEVGPKTIIADVETDKASFEIEAGFSGCILKLIPAEGDDVPVMQPIAYVGQAGEALPAGATSAPSAPNAAPAATEAAPVTAPLAPVVPTATTSQAASAFASPSARLLAASQGVDATSLPGSGPEGRVIERDVRQVLAANAPATPAALAEALARGVVRPARGTGLGGRVTLADLDTVVATASGVTVAASATLDRSFPGAKTETKIKGIRKLIGERMAESLASTAQFTLSSSASAVHLQNLRARFKASDPALGLQGITVGDLIVFATARTLKRFPYMNAHKVGDTLTEFASVHLGIACDTPRGLMVPVIRHADCLSLKQISDETKRLAEACRSSSISPDELSGSTFSVSNLGASGIESFSPVLNAPEVGILGICGINPKAVQKGDAVIFEASVGLSLTINHMVVDGAPAARFLKELCAAIASVDVLLAQ